jgi:hypothetical protein
MNSNRSRYIAAGLLAVGLSIGAALATPGPASADPSTDPYLWTDQLLGGLSVPAQTTTSDIQISIFGTDLFPLTADNTATAGSGPFDIAIAIGPGSDADSFGGIFNTAIADGASSGAIIEGGSFDTAIADGASSDATAEPGSFDVAIADGANSTADAGGIVGPCTPFFIFDCVPTATSGDFDLAAAFGDMLHASAIGNFLTDILPSL